ncbi:MAG: DUF1565 domain-containing protein [Planctomycetota bacterium]|nr:DUF1565 domain-containing protein [Planctomycetota bacterium]
MPRLAPLAILFLLLAACGGGGGVGEPQGRIDYYVDAALGSDANPGTIDLPFETITHALAVARPAPIRNGGDSVHVFAGTYDAVKETFPLVVPEGVNLLKAGNLRPTLLGGAMVDPLDAQNITAAVVLRSGAQMGAFNITNPLTSGDPGFHYGVLMAGEDVHLHMSHISGSRHGGIRVEHGDFMEIAACKIYNHTEGIGIHFAGGGKDGYVRLSDIYDNRIGVEYSAPGARLNGNGNVPGQDNKLHGNTHTDLWIAPGITVNASYNQWDHNPPSITTSSNTGGGIDIYHIAGVAGVNIVGASLYVP